MVISLCGVLQADVYSNRSCMCAPGTLAVFSAQISPGTWLQRLRDGVRNVDRRYTNGEASIAPEIFLALVAAPGFLLFAWSLFTKQSWRYIVGLLVCATQFYTQVCAHCFFVHPAV